MMMDDSVIRFRVQKMKRAILYKRFLMRVLIILIVPFFYYKFGDWLLWYSVIIVFVMMVILVAQWTILFHYGELPYEVDIYDDKVILHNQSFFEETTWTIDKSQLFVVYTYWLNAKETSILEFRKRKHRDGLYLSTENNWTKEMQLEILQILKERNMGQIYYEEKQWSNPFKIGKGQNK